MITIGQVYRLQQVLDGVPKGASVQVVDITTRFGVGPLDQPPPQVPDSVAFIDLADAKSVRHNVRFVDFLNAI